MAIRKVLSFRQLDRALAPGIANLRFSTAHTLDMGAVGSIPAGRDVTDLVRAWTEDVARSNIKRGTIVVVSLPETLPAPAPAPIPTSAPVARKAPPIVNKKQLRAELAAAGVAAPWNASLKTLLDLREAKLSS